MMEFIPARASIITMVTNAANFIRDDAAGQLLHAVSRSDGSFRLTVDQPGQYEIVSRSGDGRIRYRTIHVDIPDAESQTMEVNLTSIRIAGTVLDQTTQRPVGPATLEAVPKDIDGGTVLVAQSAADGRFSLDITKAGKYRLSAHAEGYAANGVNVEVSEAGLDDVRVELERGIAIIGRVVDSGGNGVGGVKVEGLAAADGDVNSWAISQTDSNGQFKLAGLAGVSHNLCAGIATGAFALATGVLPGDDRPVVMSLASGGQIQLVVKGRDGAPVPNAIANIVRVNGARIAVPTYGMGLSDASGTLRLPAPAGVVEIGVNKDAETGVVSVSLGSGGVASATVQLGREGRQ